MMGGWKESGGRETQPRRGFRAQGRKERELREFTVRTHTGKGQGGHPRKDLL